MKAWRRNLLIAYLACSLLMLVLFFIMALKSAPNGFVVFLAILLCIAVLGGIGVGVYLVIYSFAHEHATLHADAEGIINIERSALESIARRALESVDTAKLQKVSASVIDKKDEPVIDITLTAIPSHDASLMATAAQIQAACKQSVESFTDHEVRYVAVNFIEPRAKRNRLIDLEDREEERPEAASGEPREKVSLLDKVKARFAARDQVRDEDVVRTDAIVEDTPYEPVDTVQVEEPGWDQPTYEQEPPAPEPACQDVTGQDEEAKE